MPGHRGAPIMPSYNRLLGAESVKEADHIAEASCSWPRAHGPRASAGSIWLKAAPSSLILGKGGSFCFMALPISLARRCS
jgi:hypothetical protein